MKNILLLLLLLSSPAWAGVGFYGQSGMDALLNCGTASTILTGTSPETISLWFLGTSLISNGGTPRIMGRFASGTSTGTGAEIDVGQNNSINFSVYSNTTSMTTISAVNSLPLNSINNVIITTDGSITAANTHIYINGVETAYQVQTNGNGGVPGGGILYMGNRGDGGRVALGNVYEVDDWNIVVTAADRALIYNNGKQGYNMRSVETAALKSWWRLNVCPQDQNCTAVFTDEMGLNNCTPSNNPTGVAPVYSHLRDVVIKDAIIN